MKVAVCFYALCLCLLTSQPRVSYAQDAPTNRQAQPAERAQILLGSQSITFQWASHFSQTRILIHNHRGELSYDSGIVVNNQLVWNLRSNDDNPLKGGLYRYTLSGKPANSESEITLRGNLIIENDQGHLWITTNEDSAFGTDVQGGELTVANANGRAFAGSRTADGTARHGREVGGRALENLNNGNWNEAPNRTLLNVGGAGTAGKLTKWTTTTDVGDSILAESGAVVTATGSLNVTSNYQVNGQNALNVKVAQQSVFIGPGAGSTTTGLNNVHIGTQAGAATTTGVNNMFIGTAAGQGNTTGIQNNAIGTQAGANLSNGNNNTFIGNQAGYKTTSGINNMMIGTFAGFENLTGSNNTMIGLSAGQNSIAQSNTMIGVNAGVATTTGGENMFIGVNAGATNTTGSKNLLIGTNAKLGANNLVNAGALGYAAQVNANNALVLGGITGINGGTDTNVGIGTTTPAHKLDVTGAINSSTQFNLGGAHALSAPGTYNLLAGVAAGASLATGGYNAFFGREAGNQTTDGGANSFFGAQAGFGNTTGSFNTFMGQQAGVNNSTGRENTYLGDGAGFGVATGSTAIQNTFIGREAGRSVTGGLQCLGCGAGGADLYYGSENLFAGYRAGYANTSGLHNTFSGALAGYSNTNGARNTFVGYRAGFSSVDTLQNTFIGHDAGDDNISGSRNVFVGVWAGSGHTSGLQNTAIGDSATVASGNRNATALGYGARAECSHCVILGGADIVDAYNTKVGIGTHNPDSFLTVRNVNLTTANIPTASFSSVNQGPSISHIHWGARGDWYIRSAASNGTVVLQDNGGNVGIGTAAPDQLLTVNGNASKVGGGSWAVFSDERLKNIRGHFTTGLQALRQLQPIRYEYKADNALKLASEGSYIGFSAQAVKRVLPEAVTETASGYLQVNNDPIFWTMLNGIKEQQTQIETLQQQNVALTQQNTSLHRQNTTQLQLLSAMQKRLETVERVIVRKTRQTRRR